MPSEHKKKVSHTAAKLRKPDMKSSKSTESGVPLKRLKRSNLVGRVRLVCYTGDILVKVTDLVAVSPVMQQRQVENRLPPVLTFDDVSSDAVILLAKFIQTRTVKLQISFYTIADVLKLSKTLMIEDLSRKLEEVLLDAATKSSTNLLQALLVNDVCPISRDSEQQLHSLASLRFMDLVKLKDFAMLPAAQFLHVFASCELNVPHEIFAVDAALRWLTQQPKSAALAPAVFQLVRTAYFSKPDRQIILERCHILRFSESTIRAIRVCLDSPHDGRICLDESHVLALLPRCGLFDPKRHIHADYDMPMSRSVRQDRSSSKKSRKSQKSTRSSYSSKSRKSSGKKKH